MSPSKASPRISFTEFHNIVDGRFRDSKTKHCGINPATGEALWPVPVSTSADLDDAVAAGQSAFPNWSQTPIKKRQSLVKEWMSIYETYKDDLIALVITECGKPKSFATMEVAAGAHWAVFHTELPEPSIPVIDDDAKRIETEYVPLGVVAAICPWNFPMILSLGKIAPALIAGNCVIMKPSPFTPYSALKVCEMAQEVLPPGVFQVLGGSDEIGALMTLHEDIKKISFTGSILTGKKIMANCAQTMKRCTLELGGNDAAIVCDDVDIPTVAKHLVYGATWNSGQVCIATKRVYIHEKIYTEMVEALIEEVKKLKLGTEEGGNVVGPIQNKLQFERLATFLEDCTEKGYKCTSLNNAQLSKGYFMNPTIVDNPPEDSRIMQEEQFGPIIPTRPFTADSEAIALANNSVTGLGASVYSPDLTRARAIGKQLEVGMVSINSWEQPGPESVFGGWKESGIGNEWGSTGLVGWYGVRTMSFWK